MKVRNGFVSNSSSSSFVLVYDKKLSRDDFYKLYDNNPNDELFKNIILYHYGDEGPILAEVLDTREKIFSNRDDFEFENVYCGNIKCINDYSGPYTVPDDMVGQSMELFMSEASGYGATFIYDEEILDSDYEIYVGEEDED